VAATRKQNFHQRTRPAGAANFALEKRIPQKRRLAVSDCGR
jgi:hypothetical protein